MEGIVCKFRVNMPCRLFIGEDLYVDADGNEVVLQPGKSPNKLLLNEGEDYYRFVSVEDENILYEADITVDNEFAKPIHTIDLAPTTDTTKTETTSEQKQEFKKYDIFISYRKKSSCQRVDKLYHYLNGKYPEKVFRDNDELVIGDWLTQIVQYVDTCKMLVVVLDKDTFQDRDISNDTKERYERWATLSREELHAEIERLPLNEKKKVNYIRIEILRAKAHDAIIFPIKCGIGELSKDLENALYCKEQFEVSPTVTDNEWLTLVKDKWESSVVSELYAVQYSKQGKDILATDIYYDSNRAKKEFGFDEAFYIPRKVDDELSMYVENPKFPFCFITGLPGSGKTRAIYQLCHGALKNQSVIILTKSNVNTIADLLSSNTRKIDSQYIICDQIIDVLFVLDEEKRKTFIDKLCDSNYYHLIGSNTKARLDDFLREYSECIKYNLIEIPIIDKSIINRLIKHLKAQGKEIKVENGKTIADLIPGINEYKKAILNSLLEKTVKNEKKYLELLHNWLKSLQLVMTFRKEYRLFLAILVFKQLSERVMPTLDINWLRTCIQAMLGLNMLYLQDNNKSISKNDIGQKFIKSTNKNFKYDGEDFLDIMGKYKDQSESKNCNFEVNELIWQYLLDKTDTFKSEQFEEVLYDFSDEDDLQEAIEIYYAAFPTLSSLRRIVPRIPDSSLQAAANGMVVDILSQYINSNGGIEKLSEELAEIQLIYSLIIGRCENDNEVDSYLQKLKDTKIIGGGCYPGSIIGELYRYAENRKDTDSDDYKTYVENILKKRCYISIGEDYKIKYGDLESLEVDDLYAIEKEINALLRLKKIKLDFQSLISYIKNCFDILNVKDKNAISNDKWLVNINRLLNLLARYSNAEKENVEAISQLLKDYNLLDEESGIYPIYSIFKYLAKYANGNPDKCKNIVDQLIYIDSSCDEHDWNLNAATTKVKDFFGKFVVSAMVQTRTFEYAVQFYELYIKGIQKDTATGLTAEDTDGYKILSMAMRKCASHEFQAMVKYVEKELDFLRNLLQGTKKQTDIWRINYTIKVLMNLLMEKAPSYTDAMYYLEQLEPEQIDSYALFHVLKKVRRNANGEEQFIWAYSAINHHKLIKYRTEAQILNRLYKITSNIEQEKLVDEIAGDDRKSNYIYVSIKLGKKFRSLSEKMELYKQFYENENEGEEKALRRVDLFSTLTKEFWNVKKKLDDPNEAKKLTEAEKQVLLDDIQKVKPFLEKESKKDLENKDIDPYYTLALIHLGKLRVFDENNEITADFRNRHLNRFDTTKVWNILIHRFDVEDDTPDNDDAQKKIKMLCNLYKERYEGSKRSYLLLPDTIMRGCLKKAGISLKEKEEDIETKENDIVVEDETGYEDSESKMSDNNLDDITEDSEMQGDRNKVYWWNKKINLAKKYDKEKAKSLYKEYEECLRDNQDCESLKPDWMMYKYAYKVYENDDIPKTFKLTHCEFIMRVLNDCTIIPSRLADVLEHICILQQAKKEIPTIQEIMDTIDQQNLWRMIEVDHRSLVSLYLFILKQTTQREEFLNKYKNKFDKLDDFANNNLKSLGVLSRTEILMTHNSLRCTLYFYKWLQGYLDIYKSEKVFLKHYSSNDHTIQNHIQIRKRFDPLFMKYLNSSKEYKTNDALPHKIRLAETLGAMLECYKVYTIETLVKIYNELDPELQSKLSIVDNNASVQDIIEALNKYVSLKDKIIEFYETESRDILIAAILGSAKSQYEYGKCNDSDMIIPAVRRGHQEAVNESVKLLHSRNTKFSLKIKIYQALESIDHKFNQEDWYVVAKAYKMVGKFSQYVECCKKAADLGHALAAHELWKIYEVGREIEKSLDLSRFWMKRAAELKHPDAQKTQHNLDELLKSFEEVKADKFKDLAQLQELANKGLAEAQQCLGAQYYNLAFGSNLAKEKLENYKLAYQYFMKAANQGFAISQYYVGFCFETGNGVEKDSNEAKKWYQLAANQGHQSAIKKLQNLM